MNDDRLISRKVMDVLNLLMIAAVILTLAITASGVIVVTRRTGEFNQRQIAYVQQQNDAQLCAQHDIIVSVRKIGTKLGLPVTDIVAPDVEGLDCP